MITLFIQRLVIVAVSPTKYSMVVLYSEERRIAVSRTRHRVETVAQSQLELCAEIFTVNITHLNGLLYFEVCTKRTNAHPVLEHCAWEPTHNQSPVAGIMISTWQPRHVPWARTGDCRCGHDVPRTLQSEENIPCKSRAHEK